MSIKIIQFLFAIAMLSSNMGCNKDDDVVIVDLPEYFVKAKVDGSLVEYKNRNALDGSIYSGAQGVFRLDMFGGKLDGGQSGVSESITINLTDTAPISTNSYSGYAPFEHGLKGVLILYSFDNEDIVYSTDVSVTNASSFLEITEITQSSIRGKFNGVVREVFTQDTKTISDGEFFVPRSE